MSSSLFDDEMRWKNRPVKQRSKPSQDYLYFANNYRPYTDGQRLQANI